MDNIVETYLMFKANSVYSYINILAEELRKISKIPKGLNKLIYKYYDLFILSDKEISSDLLKTKTGLDEKDARLLLFYLLIEFDFASKTEYKDPNEFNFYNIIVNSIIIFSSLENEKINNKKIEYEEAISKVLKENLEIISDDYILLLDKAHDNLKKLYTSLLKKEMKFNEIFNSPTYTVNYKKVKRSNEFYFEKLRYKNDKLAKESKNDISLIKKEFKYELNLVNLEMTSLRILKDTFNKNKRTIFIKLNDEIFIKKTNLEHFINMFKLRFLKERIIFLVNTSLLEKYEERISSLILENFNISYFKDCELTTYDIYKNGGYLIIDYEDIKKCHKFSKEYNLELIINNANDKEIKEINNIKYIPQ